MPIGPDELDRAITETDQQAFDALVVHIDKQLPVCDRGETSVYVPVRPYPNPRVEARVVAAYLDAGWRAVRFDDDQREGSSLVLTRPTRPAGDPYPQRD